MKKYRGFIAGMLTMLIIVSLAGTASATLGKITKELEYRNIKVSLDGEVLDLKDAAGNHVEPFMFDGTNYLPVRALAEALGLNVAWDGSTSTVVLTSEPTEEATPAKTQDRKDLLFSREHVRVYALGIEQSDDGGQDVKFFVENESDYVVKIMLSDVEISGKRAYVQVSGKFSCPEINPGDQSEAVLHYDKETLTEKGADEFKSIRLGFYCSAKVNDPALPGVSSVKLFETGQYKIER